MCALTPWTGMDLSVEVAGQTIGTAPGCSTKGFPRERACVVDLGMEKVPCTECGCLDRVSVLAVVRCGMRRL